MYVLFIFFWCWNVCTFWDLDFYTDFNTFASVRQSFCVCVFERSCVSLNACLESEKTVALVTSFVGHMVTLWGSRLALVCASAVLLSLWNEHTKLMAGSFMNSDFKNESHMSKCWPVPKKLTGILVRGWFNANRESSYWNVMSDMSFSSTRWNHRTICLYIKCWIFFFLLQNISRLNNRLP